MEILNESHVEGLMNSEQFAPLCEADKSTMHLLLQNAMNEANSLNEGTDTGAIAQFTPILMPLVRRVYPRLIANDVLGVQPMTMPTGYIYALTNQYIGDGYTHANPNNKAIIVEAAADHGLKVGDTVFTDGKVLYVEGTKVLVSYDTASATAAYKVPAAGETFGTSVVKAVYSNEAAFYRIFKNYTGTMTTAQAEVKGKDMTEIGFSITKKSIEARARNLKGRYTVEMYQDLKAQHGLLADEEIMSLLSYEMQAEIDRDVVDFVNKNATQLPDTQFPTLSGSVYNGQGRWEIERYRTEAIRISNEASMIGVDTKRGQGNILIVSPKVCSMLREVGRFQTAPVGNTSLNVPTVGGVAGTFDDRFKVVVDQYATTDYITTLYKGDDRRDAMGFFAPYVPLSFTNVMDPESGQPAVIAKVRYGLATIPGVISAEANDRAKTYARSWSVDFANTVLAGNHYNFGQV
jgi:hypothetical protein